MLLGGDLEAVRTRIKVGALAALVSGAHDRGITEVTPGIVDNGLELRWRSSSRGVTVELPPTAVTLEHGVDDDSTGLPNLEELVEWIVVLRSVVFLDAGGTQIVVCALISIAVAFRKEI